MLKKNQHNNHPVINSCQAVFSRVWNRCSDPAQRGLSPDMIRELHEYRNKLKLVNLTN